MPKEWAGTAGRDGAEDSENFACERIRTAISQGRLPSGFKLTEVVLADELGISRAAMRSALHRLAFEELVELKRNRGAFVASPTVQEARNVFAARRVIERATTEIVTRTILTPQLAALRRNFADLESDWLGGRRQGSIERISTFHRQLALLAHNRALSVALERLILQTSLVLGLYGTSGMFAIAAAHYKELLDLIESGASLKAADAMERCLDFVEYRLDLRPADLHEADLHSMFMA